jgi:ligand-binding SRPBCC domain-containing protein
MKKFYFQKETLLPISLNEAWDFFSLTANLEKITPTDVKFETLTKLGNTRLRNGLKIKYKLRPLLNIPLNWETEILHVNAPYQFMDKQIKGPYSFWEHTHTFTEVVGGVKMTDSIVYAMPVGWLGIFMHSVIIKKKLKQIFRYREKVLRDMFRVFKQ